MDRPPGATGSSVVGSGVVGSCAIAALTEGWNSLATAAEWARAAPHPLPSTEPTSDPNGSTPPCRSSSTPTKPWTWERTTVSPVTPDDLAHAPTFTGTINWAQIDTGSGHPDRVVTADDLFRIATARQVDTARRMTRGPDHRVERRTHDTRHALPMTP
jgi:hypothetical protein